MHASFDSKWAFEVRCVLSLCNIFLLPKMLIICHYFILSYSFMQQKHTLNISFKENLLNNSLTCNLGVSSLMYWSHTSLTSNKSTNNDGFKPINDIFNMRYFYKDIWYSLYINDDKIGKDVIAIFSPFIGKIRKD